MRIVCPKLKLQLSNGEVPMLRSLMSAIPLRDFMRDRRGNVILMFAGMSLGLVLMVGAGVDYTRATQFKTALQSLADAAALAGASVYVSSSPDTGPQGIAKAQAYWDAGLAKIANNSGVTAPTITSSFDASGYYIHVTSLGSTTKTTFLSAVGMNTMTVGISATAKDPIVNATVDFNGWTADAGDGNSIYWYKVPSDQSIPAFTQANIDNGTFGLVFSNVIDTPATLSFSIAAAQQMAFAFVNTTAGHSPTWNYCNQYGSCATAAGHSTNTLPTHIFYSQLSNPNGATSTQAPNGFGYTDGSKFTGGAVQNCSLEVRTYTGTAPTDPSSTGSCTAPPTQANIDPYFSPSCASLGGTKVHYSWNDLGGTNGKTPSQDDKDYNDGQYNFSCSGGGTTTGVILTD
jgi:Flp pilus assembly protein TadG